MNRGRRCFVAGFGALLLSACVHGRRAPSLPAESAVALRSYQARAFDTTDRLRVLRAAVATLQDLEFVIDAADATLGSLTATRLDGRQLRATVTVSPRGTGQTLVRINANAEQEMVTDLSFFQDFFAALEKAMFLQAHQVG